VREHTASLKLKGNKWAKKSETDAQEVSLYKTFLERKKKILSPKRPGFAR
jgi:hypothetical protein